MTTEPYAICNTCGIDLESPEAADQHRSATVDEAVASGTKVDGAFRSHSTRVVNPTPEERAEREVRRIVDDGIERICEGLDEAVYRGEVTTEQVNDAVRQYPDIADAWDEFNEESR